jgi:hypothetical protein
MNIERKMSYGIGGAGNIRTFPCILCLVPYGMRDVMTGMRIDADPDML